MKNIFFVCHGNICRSPAAEFIFKKAIKERGLEDEYRVDSFALSIDVLSYSRSIKTSINNHFAVSMC